jgi:hypothetical protein
MKHSAAQLDEQVSTTARRERLTGNPEERKQVNMTWFVLFGGPIILGAIWNALASLF